jgi:hypothetical protein
MKNSENFPTWEQLESMLQNDDCENFCLACGEEAYGVEPDAEKYECECCGEREVYGSHNVLIMGAFKGGRE